MASAMRPSLSFWIESFSMQSSECARSMAYSVFGLFPYSPSQEVSGDSSTIRRIVTERMRFLLFTIAPPSRLGIRVSSGGYLAEYRRVVCRRCLDGLSSGYQRNFYMLEE